MKSAGYYLLLFGIGSILLSFFNMEFRILSWIHNWGPTVGWAIQIGAAVCGGVCWLIGYKQEQNEASNNKSTI